MREVAFAKQMTEGENANLHALVGAAHLAAANRASAALRLALLGGCGIFLRIF